MVEVVRRMQNQERNSETKEGRCRCSRERKEKKV